MIEKPSLKEWAVVSCGTMSPELQHLRDSGWLDAMRIAYTTPGLHQDLPELERQLVYQVQRAKTVADKVLVVYGSEFCYINLSDPYRTMDTIVDELGPGVYRVRAKQCVDMLASETQREAIRGGEDVIFLTPGWIKFRQYVYKGWDRADANQNFPQHSGGIILLDGVGYFDQMAEEDPEKLLEFSDWAGVPVTPYPVSLDRLKNLLLEPLTLEASRHQV